MTPEQREQVHAVHDLVVQADHLVEQVQRIESFLTFAPPDDRDLAKIARAIDASQLALQVKLDRYIERWVPHQVPRPNDDDDMRPTQFNGGFGPNT